MADQIKAMVEGGKASAGPPLGPALGPLGLPINKVIEAINEKTAAFKGMQVPVTVTILENREFEILVGTPPTSALIKKELKLDKASGSPKAEKVADMLIEQAIKIAKMKEDAMMSGSMKARVKTVVGSCVSMGINVEGVDAKEALQLIDDGKFDAEIKSEKTELSAEELKDLETRKTAMTAELAKTRAVEEEKANTIIKGMEGKERSDIKSALKDAEISTATINRLLPEDATGSGVGAAATGDAAAGDKKDAPKEEKKE